MFCQKCGTQNPDNGKFCRACGTDLGKGSTEAGGLFQPIEPIPLRNLSTADYYIDRKGRRRSNNPDELWSAGVRNIISGIGFLVIAIALLVTGVAGGHDWWWAMLFPAFSLLSSGVGNVAKAKRLEKKQLPSIEMQTQPSPPLTAGQQNSNAGLPPLQTDIVMPQKSIYDTGEFAVPPSVTENTTRHLEMNSEGETMTLQESEKRKS